MVPEIQQAVERELGLPEGSLSSASHGGNGRREEPIFRGRWVAVNLAREFIPTVSACYLSRYFYQEHSSALYALKTFEKKGGKQWPEYLRCRPLVAEIAAKYRKAGDEYVIARDAAIIAKRDSAVSALTAQLSSARGHIQELSAEVERLKGEVERLGADGAIKRLNEEIATLRAENVKLRATSINANLAHEVAVLKRENRKLRGDK